MAGVLPRFLVLKSGVTGLCARYREDDIGLVRCDEKNVTSPYAKIEVEPSQQHKDYFHLRFCYSNRYFAMVPENSVDDPGHGYVVARSKQPIDDPCDETCCDLDRFCDEDEDHDYRDLDLGMFWNEFYFRKMKCTYTEDTVCYLY